MSDLGPAFIGNRHILDHLKNAHERGRLAHAYLFTGPDGVGKRTAARLLASLLLETGTPERHPDFFLVERGRDPKTGKLHGDIIIGQILELVGRVARAAFMGGWKVCIIDGAELLNNAAGNALLKTLEEPHGRAVIILIAPTPAAVLPTLRSRCQPLEFRTAPAADIAQALEKEGIPAAQAALFARLSGGRPGAALALARDPVAFRVLRETREQVLKLLEGGTPERFEVIGKLLPPKMPFAESADRARAVLDIAAEILRDTTVLAAGLPDKVIHSDIADRLENLAKNRPGPAGIRAALDDLASSRRLLDENVGARNALERFAISF